MPRRKKCCYTPLGEVAAAATAAGMSYGKYVARQYAVLHKSKRQPSPPSKWVHPHRTILEGLNKELSHPETRAEYLNDPEAKRQLLIAEANERERRELIRKSRDAECRVQSWCRSTEEIIRKRGYNSVR